MFGRLIGSVKDHNFGECCSSFMPKGTEKRVLTIGFLTFCLFTFTFEAFFEFFSFSFHAFANIKIDL